MNPYDKLMGRIQVGERVLIDGATGTEIERRGVPQLNNAWNGGGALSHPLIVREVHEDYIRAGAEIVISNTFATAQHALRDAGVGEQFEDYNRRGVELAVEARQHLNAQDVLVAGGISYWSWTKKHPPLETLRQTVSRQAAIMSEAGADLLMLEMMVDIDRMVVTLEAAQSSGLPVWAGLTCMPDSTGKMCLWNGEPLVDAVAEIKKRGVPLVNIMHTEVEFVDACLDVLDDHWSAPVGVYAHSGGYDNGKWIFDDMITPRDYAIASTRWLERGVRVLGGCCGIRTEHIAKLSEII